jgi:hypothetical protein
MRVPFTAYAIDSIVHGELVLEGDRLSDFLAQDGPFEIEDVTLEALDDGRQVQIAAAAIARSDLVAITASGPRGNAARRVRTRPHAAHLQAGPYEIVGYMHAPPSAHPFTGVQRRQVLPVTSAVIQYDVAGRRFESAYEVLLVNATAISWLQAANDADVRLAKALPVPSNLDPHAKDMTGELMT